MLKTPAKYPKRRALRAFLEASLGLIPGASFFIRIFQSTHPPREEFARDEFEEDLVASVARMQSAIEAHQIIGGFRHSSIAWSKSGISSVADLGVGDLLVNLAKPMPSTSYHVDVATSVGFHNVIEKTLSSFRITIRDQYGRPIDPEDITFRVTHSG